MITRIAEQADIPQLKEIWRQCFGDSDEYINCFFDDMFSAEDMAVAEESGKAVSMAALLPVSLVLDGISYPMTYLYAMGTLPEYQGRGIGRGLLAFAADYCKERGDCGIALLPGEKSLEDFYGPLGYKAGVFSIASQSENYIKYPERYINHIVNIGRLEESAEEEPCADGACSGIPADILSRSAYGMFLPLRELPKFKAYMAYPMD